MGVGTSLGFREDTGLTRASSPSRLQSDGASWVRHDNPMVDKLTRSFRLMAVLAVSALMLAVSGMVVVSARSLDRFEPVHRHGARLQELRWVEDQLMRLGLAVATEEKNNASQRLEAARKGLEALIAEGGYLDPGSEEQLADIASSLSADDPALANVTLEAVRKIEHVLSSEMRAHDTLLSRVEGDTEWELGLSAALALGLPFASGLLVFALRRRILAPLGHLRTLMDLLARREYKTVPTTDLDPLLQPVYANYNDMASRLHDLERTHLARQATLEQEVRAATGELLQQQRTLARSERLAATGELAASVAHELRNPLAGIQMTIRGVMGQLDDDDLRSRLQLVLAELKRVTRLLNDMLSTAKPELELTRLVRLDSVVRDFCVLARYQIPENVRIVEDVPEGLECRLPEEGLKQALWNLVINASQAIAERNGEIVIAAARTDGKLRLEVTDDGPGFPDAILQSGVRSFVSLRQGGTGLGLATVRRFANDLGGELHIENRVGSCGATVALEIPCGQTS